MGIHQYRKPQEPKPESLGIRLYTMKEAVKETRLPYGTLRRAVKEGRLKRADSRTHGWKFTADELQRFMKSLEPNSNGNGHVEPSPIAKKISLDQLVELGLSEGILRDYIAAGKLPHYTLNGKIFFNESDVAAFLDHRHKV